MELSQMWLRGHVTIWRDEHASRCVSEKSDDVQNPIQLLGRNGWRVQSNVLDFPQRILPEGFSQKSFPEEPFSQKTFPHNNNRQTDLDLENCWDITFEEEWESKGWFCKIYLDNTAVLRHPLRVETIHPFLRVAFRNNFTLPKRYFYLGWENQNIGTAVEDYKT